MTHKIEKIWVFTTECEDYGEGVCAMVKSEKYQPLFTTSENTLDDMTNLAREMAKDLGIVVKLCEFSNKIVLQVIKPVEH